jgi:anthranilate phosphoribosyltransferase
MPTIDMMTEEVFELTKAIAQVLTGKDPALQGAALADAVALYFAGHHPSFREGAIAAWLHAMQDLIPINERGVLEHYGDIWADAPRVN